MIFVEFESGDPRFPMWKHGHFGRLEENQQSEIPPHLRDPDIYWFRTPGGLGIEFNDKTKEVKIYGGDVHYKSITSVLQVGGNLVEVTDTGVNITLEAGSKFYINGNKPILYSKLDGVSEITSFDEIGVSKTARTAE
jgi:hypothetical protein